VRTLCPVLDRFVSEEDHEEKEACSKEGDWEYGLVSSDNMMRLS